MVSHLFTNLLARISNLHNISMSLEFFADCIIQTEDIREIKHKLEEVDLSMLETRNEHGNSLLHLLVQADCDVAVFEVILKRSNIAIRNEELKLVQDLFVGRKNEKIYEQELVDCLADKLRNCEGDYIRGLIVQGWNHEPYLENAIDKLMDELNDNFTGFLSSIECLLENMRYYTQQIVDEDFDNLQDFKASVESPKLNTAEIILFRNHYGLTLQHIATIFEKYEYVKVIMNLSLEHDIKLTDNMGRTALHYLHSIKSTPQRDEIISAMATSPCYNFVDFLGNCPAYYECYPHLLNFDYYKELIKTDLMKMKITNRKNSVARETPSPFENDSVYLKKTIGKALVAAFALVVEKRPIDPIDYLGNFLKFYATNMDNSDYQYETLSSKINIDLSNRPTEKIYTFNPEIFSPFTKVARDKHGTPYGYKLLIKKLQTLNPMDVDWFEIVKRGINFALRDCNEHTLLEMALSMNFMNIKEHFDSVILNMVKEENVRALENIYTCGYFDNMPDIYELCGPDLFGVSQEVAEFYTGLPEQHGNTLRIFAGKKADEEEAEVVDWSGLIKTEMSAFAYSNKGMSVIHWAIVSNNETLFRYLVDGFPDCLKLKDCFNRNVCHYCVAFQNKRFGDIVDEFYPMGREELDCFDYLPEYYEFYNSAFRNLV